MDLTQIDQGSLTDEQLEAVMELPLTDKELALRNALEAQHLEADKIIHETRLEQGKILFKLKTGMLWQRDEIFKTKSGAWKKKRSWNIYIKTKFPSFGSAKAADQLIAQWQQHVTEGR